MQPKRIKTVPGTLNIKFANQAFVLPADIRAKLDEHWLQACSANPYLHNGEVFSVTEVVESGDRLDITLAETDYAHYLYTQYVGDLGEYSIRVIHPATLLVSKDNKFIFGAMGKHTSLPGVIQCCGGGLDRDDLKDGFIDIEHNAAKELSEEVGLDVQDENRVVDFSPTYLKSGGIYGKMTIVFVLHLNETAEVFLRKYNKFAQGLKDQGELPEFDEILCVDSDQKTIETFINQHESHMNDYMDVLLRRAAQDLSENN